MIVLQKPNPWAGLAQGLMNFTQGYNQRYLRNLAQQDLQSLSNWGQQFSPNFVGPVSPMPAMQSPMGQSMMFQGLAQRAFQDPLERQYLQERINATRALTDSRQMQEQVEYKPHQAEYWRKLGYNEVDAPIAARTAAEISAGLRRRETVTNIPIEELPDEKQLDFWQNILKGAQDSLGLVIEGQEKTFDLATRKIEEVRGQMEGPVEPAAQPRDEMGRFAPKPKPESLFTPEGKYVDLGAGKEPTGAIRQPMSAEDSRRAQKLMQAVPPEYKKQINDLLQKGATIQQIIRALQEEYVIPADL